MLLSRVANSVYWLGRYLERAENVNRHLIVAGEFSVELEGLDDEIALAEWASLRQSMPHGAEEYDTVLAYLRSHLVDKNNMYSVLTSLGKARDNARSVAETITVEVTTNLNDAYRKLSMISPRSVTDLGVAHELADRTHNSILTTLGAVEHTLTRGESWNYMKLGEAMERTQRTLYVMRARLPGIVKWSEEQTDPLYFASWRSLLLSLGTLENYRQQNGPRFTPEMVTRFLLFDAEAPRAVNCGFKRMVGYVQKMSENGPGVRECRRRLGRMAAQLEFDQPLIMEPNQLMPFIDSALETLYEVHELISGSMKLS